MKLIKKSPFSDSIFQKIYRIWISFPYVFDDSKSYWKERYQLGGSSGNGSYNELAEFKAEIVNQFVSEKNINSIIEYGCGDGNQLLLYNIPSYLGFDISPEIILLCREMFFEDDEKSFKLVEDYQNETADLTMSLDVIYHLVEDSVYSLYMNRLFDSSEKYVIIYSSNTDNNSIIDGAHVKHRNFTGWVEKYKPEWELIKFIPNRYPIKENGKNGSISDFFIYQIQDEAN